MKWWRNGKDAGRESEEINQGWMIILLKENCKENEKENVVEKQLSSKMIFFF